jgi:hypothetical protein
MARNTRLSAGADHAITPTIRVGAIYAHINGGSLLRGLNLNQPVNSVRPTPSFGNIIEVVGDARSRQNQLNAYLQVFILPPSPVPSKERWNWKRTNFGINYNLSKSENNSDGAFSAPATGSLAAEWGPASNDVRNRLGSFMTLQWLRNFKANLNQQANSASPYTIRTGFDDNGDSIFNDRPIGVGRNTARGDGFMSLNGNFNYSWAIGSRKIQLPPGIMINGGPGGFNVQTFQNDGAPRFRIGFFVTAQNMTNHRNYGGFSGTLTSPFFGQPTLVTGMRKIDMGINFNF